MSVRSAPVNQSHVKKVVIHYLARLIIGQAMPNHV